MFDFFTPNHPFGGQTLRLVAQAQQGGGDVFDIARTCESNPATKRVGNGNGSNWRKRPKPKQDRRQPRTAGTRRSRIFFTPTSTIECPTCF